MLKCSLCGQTFEKEKIDEYVDHIQKCAATQKAKIKEAEEKEANNELEELLRMERCYEGMKEKFLRKYPNLYREHFKDHKCTGNKYGSKLVDVTNEMSEEIPEFIREIADMIGAEIKVLTEV
ncbi:hypothetical protein [Clostridium sp.]|uniref:hypothetical protein n=1 Tax=Clostridium sp. TaxID=1506 RepID=UPI0032165AA4